MDLADLDAFRAAVGEHTRMVWVETPTNPFLKIVDIAAAAEIAHAAGARCVVDNTFATPYLQRPLELGADVVVHSRHEVPRRALGPDRRRDRHLATTS